MIDNRAFVRTFAVVTLFTVLAGDSLRYSLTWYGWSVVVLAIATLSVMLLIQGRARWRFSQLPFPLLAFVALTFISVAWSDYRAWTLVGALLTLMTAIAAAALAVALTWKEILWALGVALRIILASSLLFELVISVFVRRPILPWWANYGTQKIHPAYYWSRDLLFKGERIQGIMGNSDLLGFVALLGLIVFGIQLVGRSVRLGWGIAWLVIAAADVALTRSATVTIAIVAVAIVTAVLVLIRTRQTRRGRISVYVGSIAVAALGVAGTIAFNRVALGLLNKTSTLTGRTNIWHTVIHLASQRPVGGWGWIGYWVPFVAPFKGLIVIGGVQYLQAHEAWLDVWFQLGIVGLVVFGALVLSTLVRSWAFAIDRPMLADGTPGKFSATSLLPILLLVALLAQSLAESRLLIEYGMLLLALIAIKTKHPDPVLRG